MMEKGHQLLPIFESFIGLSQIKTMKPSGGE
jgi:hypothetical protein